jgi:hypothetical protein
MMKRIVVLGTIALALSATAANAQRTRSSGGPVELGIDGGVQFGLDDPNLTVVQLPIQAFRLGYFLSDKLELEPRLNLNSIHGGGFSLTTYQFELGVLFIPKGDRVGKGLYVRPLLGVIGASGEGSSDNTAYGGAGVGLKIPFADRRLAFRTEANYSHGFSSGGSNAIGLTAGLSWFSR